MSAEEKTKFNKYVSPNWFEYLENWDQYENSIDFNREIVRKVLSSNNSSNSKQLNDNDRANDLEVSPWNWM